MIGYTETAKAVTICRELVVDIVGLNVERTR